MKDGIAAMLEPHELPGSSGVITLALLELGIEWHLRICPTEQSACDLFDALLKNVLEGRNTGGMTAVQLPAVFSRCPRVPIAHQRSTR